MKTERLYHCPENPLDFTARVVQVEGDAVALDRTAFYPEAGGQPCDVGRIECDGVQCPVLGVWVEDGSGIIWHRLGTPTPAIVRLGMIVTGRVDPTLRHAHSAHHTALHVLNGLVFRDYGARVTGAQIHAERSRMDFELDSAGMEMRERLQAALDTEVARAATVRTYWLSRADFAKDTNLVRTVGRTVPFGEQVRIVEVEGLDRQACGGTHLASVGDLARIVLLTFKSKGRNNKRAEIEVELQ